MLLKLINLNEQLSAEINEDICQRIVDKLKKSKYLSLDKMDIVKEFDIVVRQQLIDKYADYTSNTSRINEKTNRPASTNCY